MAVKSRQGISTSGPGGGSAWEDFGGAAVIQNHGNVTASTTATEYIIDIIPAVSAAVASDALAAGGTLQNLYGAQWAPSAALIAQATLSLAVGIRRGATGALVGGTYAFGWLNGAGGGTPAFGTAFVTTTMPIIAANTAKQGTSPNQYFNLQIGDVITWLLQTSSGTVVVPVGLINTLVN